MVLSERNLIMITYKTDSPEEDILSSVMSRLLMIANKNVLPVSLMILGLGKSDTNMLSQRISIGLIKLIDKLQTDLQTAIDKVIKYKRLIYWLVRYLNK